MTLIGLVITLVIIGLLLYIVTLIPMDGTIKKIITIVVILIAVLYVLQALGFVGSNDILNQRIGR